MYVLHVKNLSGTYLRSYGIVYVFHCIYLTRQMNKSDLGVPLTSIALIILLVDQNISNNTLNECSDISTNATISMFSFRHNLLNVTLKYIHM